MFHFILFNFMAIIPSLLNCRDSVRDDGLTVDGKIESSPMLLKK